MVDSFGEALRQLREERGLSLAQLAKRVAWSKSLVGLIETGVRRASAEFAQACDLALDSAPILTTLCGLDGEENSMRRRALMGGLATALGLGALGSFQAIAEAIRQDLEEAADVPQDWDAKVVAFRRRFVTDPSAVFGDELLASMLLARQQVSERQDPDALRASANLALLYGLWMGNLGNMRTGLNFFRTAHSLALRSGDQPTQIYVMARTASAGPYQGLSRVVTEENIDGALALAGSRPSAGVLEAHAAAVHLAALSGDLAGGRDAVDRMWRVADALDVPDGPGPAQRAALFSGYLEGRLGSLRDAERAWGRAQEQLAGLPQWLIDAKMYYALALVRHGDPRSGVQTALTAAQDLRYSNRVIRLGVDDVLGALPAGYRDDAVDELAAHGTTGPKPWELV